MVPGPGQLWAESRCVLDTHALRLLGAAREAAYFATAPFVGALVAIPVLGERFQALEWVAGALMVAGVLLLLRERHGHAHTHEALEHEHLHVHDAHPRGSGKGHCNAGSRSEPARYPATTAQMEPMSERFFKLADV